MAPSDDMIRIAQSVKSGVHECSYACIAFLATLTGRSGENEFTVEALRKSTIDQKDPRWTVDMLRRLFPTRDILVYAPPGLHLGRVCWGLQGMTGTTTIRADLSTAATHRHQSANFLIGFLYPRDALMGELGHQVVMVCISGNRALVFEPQATQIADGLLYQGDIRLVDIQASNCSWIIPLRNRQYFWRLLICV